MARSVANLRALPGAISTSVNRAEVMRAKLPVQTYLEILHRVATTGTMPQVNPINGRIMTNCSPTPVAPKERLEVLRFLVDKAMPNHAAAKVDVSNVVDTQAVIESANTVEDLEASLRKLTPNQLKDMIITNAEFTPTPDSRGSTGAPPESDERSVIAGVVVQADIDADPDDPDPDAADDPDYDPTRDARTTF